MTTILLTRSQEENLKLKRQLKKYDFNCIAWPLIKYVNVKWDIKVLSLYSYIIITSVKGAKILAELFHHNLNKNKTILSEKDTTLLEVNKFSCWVVGRKAAALIRKIGMKINYIAANIDELIEYLPKNIYKKTIYLSSNKITRPLSPQIKRQIIYNVIYCNELTSYQLKSIKKGIDYLLFYSQNCVKTFTKLIVKYKIAKMLENSIIIAISLKVANTASAFFTNRLYCEKGKPEQMIKILINDVKSRKSKSYE